MEENKNSGENNEMNQDIMEKRKQKVISFFKDPHIFWFVVIFAFAIIVKIYYFNMTKSQPLWWDEADYMAYAKTLAGLGSTWIVSPHHYSIFPYIASIFFRLGVSEIIVKFFLEILPSIAIVFLTYKISLEMYKNKKIALIACFLMATFWSMLFDGMRFQVDVPALFFALMAVFVFWQGYEKKKKIFGKISPNWAVPLAVIFVILTYGIRRGYFIFGLMFLIYMVLTKKLKELIKDKYNWIALAIALVLVFIFEKSIFMSSAGNIAQLYSEQRAPFNFLPFQIFDVYFKNEFPLMIGDSTTSFFFSTINFILKTPILFYLVWVGMAVLIFNVLMSFGYIKKPESSETRSDLFNLIMIAVHLSFFLFISPLDIGIGDPRWHFPLIFSSIICISRSAVLISEFFKEYGKYLPAIIIFFLIGCGGLYELNHADMIIKNKLNTYEGVKQAGLFLKQISNKGDMILTVPIPQTAYYSERPTTVPAWFLNKTANTNTTLDEFLIALKNNKDLKYIVVTISEPNHPSWMKEQEYAQDPRTGQAMFSKLKIPFMDTEIDFITGQQNIKQSKVYEDVEFRLLGIKEDAFIYEIVRNSSI